MDLNNFLNTHAAMGDNEQSTSLEAFLDAQFFPGHDAQGLNVSNEGFMDILRSIKDFFFNPKPSVGKMTGGWLNRTDVIRKTLAKTYMDATWLSRRKFVEGEVRAHKFITAITADGQWTPELLARVEAYCSGIMQPLTLTENEIGRFSSDASEIIKLYPNYFSDISFADVFKVERQIGRLKPVTINVREHFELGGTDLLISTERVSYVNRTSRVLNIPALDADGIRNACTAILALTEILDHMNHAIEVLWRNPNIAKIQDLKDNLEYYTNVNQEGASIDESLAHELERQFDTLAPPIWKYYENHFNYILGVIKSIAQLVDASVK